MEKKRKKPKYLRDILYRIKILNMIEDEMNSRFRLWSIVMITAILFMFWTLIYGLLKLPTEFLNGIALGLFISAMIISFANRMNIDNRLRRLR